VDKALTSKKFNPFYKNFYNPDLAIQTMPNQDTSEIKQKIISIIKRRGPSLPVHIASETNLSILFTSAFLSELFSEKKIKMSNMKVGSSPIYFISGQEFMLQNFSQYLKSKERDAFLLLKEKKILKDSEQDPAIRVALRAIKDFAMPFKKNDEIFWRYFTAPETEIKIKEEVKKEIEKKPEEEKKLEELGIFEETKKKHIKKRSSKKNDDKFFNKVKEFLSSKNTEILDIESFSKNELILRIREEGKNKLLFAHNKKRINEKDLIKANKKVAELNLQYAILSLGEPTKKLDEFIEAVKNLSKIEKIK